MSCEQRQLCGEAPLHFVLWSTRLMQSRVTRAVLRTVIVVVMALVAAIAVAADLPDSDDTPGAVNPAVTQDSIDTTICVPGFTATIRPPSYYTTTLKKQQLKKKKYRDKNTAHYEEDHLISLEIGGHPKSPNNLWPQGYAGDWGAKKKDSLENKLHHMVCDGAISLRDAQKKISEDWISAYKEFMSDE